MLVWCLVSGDNFYDEFVDIIQKRNYHITYPNVNFICNFFVKLASSILILIVIINIILYEN